jgi:hypothetical protein
MLIRQWMGEEVDLIPGLCQEATPRNEWPFEPDWIVTRIALDTGNRQYHIEGRHAHNGETFRWGLRVEPLYWRYDLTGARLEVGRHETDSEARKREFGR